MKIILHEYPFHLTTLVSTVSGCLTHIDDFFISPSITHNYLEILDFWETGSDHCPLFVSVFHDNLVYNKNSLIDTTGFRLNPNDLVCYRERLKKGEYPSVSPSNGFPHYGNNQPL